MHRQQKPAILYRNKVVIDRRLHNIEREFTRHVTRRHFDSQYAVRLLVDPDHTGIRRSVRLSVSLNEPGGMRLPNQIVIAVGRAIDDRDLLLVAERGPGLPDPSDSA